MNTTTFTTLSGLRRLLPQRAISYPEALAVAEKQANRLAARHRDGSVQEADLLSLTAISIETDTATTDDEHSGSSHYDRGRWVIQLDATEPRTRQRFTLAHEIKHIIDATNAEAYARLTDRQIEHVCDHFAACLLMSKPAVYRLWGRGIRTPEALAAGLRVSLAAITIRLNTMGLPINSGTRQRFACRPRPSSFPHSTAPDTLAPPQIATIPLSAGVR
jgi:Zn-dependent peptidase ImmA (M78 family)